MKRILLALLLLTGCTHLPTPEIERGAPPPKKGLDLLGLAMIPAKLVKQEMDNNMCIGFLDGTFGDPYPNLKVLLDSGKVTCIRAHLGNGPCIRARNCAVGEPNYTNVRTIELRAQKLGAFMKAYPTVQVYVSPFLEHDEKRSAAVEGWYRMLRQRLPNAKLVCSRTSGYCPKNVLSENHVMQPADIVSPDGVSHYDINSFRLLNIGKEIVFSWIDRFNLRVTGETTFIPPLRRLNPPTVYDIRQTVRMLRPPAPEPSVPGCQKVSDPDLYKTNAEDYGKFGDARANKGLLITSIRTSGWSIRKLNNTQIGTLGFYGSFAGGGWRYYVGSPYGSNQRPTDLMDALGNEWGLLRSGGKCFLFNSIRRLGTYRTAP